MHTYIHAYTHAYIHTNTHTCIMSTCLNTHTSSEAASLSSHHARGLYFFSFMSVCNKKSKVETHPRDHDFIDVRMILLVWSMLCVHTKAHY